ncbi:MAG: hypothetical protein KatS3mg087_1246 [Patescibacteria group bacterium]|nr:MAG: hypothetical protein KatS3mg087_1246 [Patescibacteria group bacterium]
MITWTGTRKQLGKKKHSYSYYYQCGRKNIKKFGFVCPVLPIPSTSIEQYVINFVRELLKDPQATFNYQKELKSSKLLTKHFETRRNDFVEALRGIPKRLDNLLYHHEQGYINKKVFEEKINDVKNTESRYKAELAEIDQKLSSITLSRGYEESLKLYSEKYSKAFDKLSENKTELYELIHMLIDQIVVYSRQATKNDVIAGRKKENQMIPERVDIYLNLPQHLLQQLYREKFVVKHDNL